MPIGSTNVYNPGDLILSTVSGSGTSFIETKIAAATSSLILFNSNGTLTSASLNSTTVGTSSYVSGSTSIITSITASAISASGKIQANQLTASSILASNGPLMVTGSNAYIQMFPVGGFPLPTSLTASYIYTSGSTNDLYFTQYNGPYTNTTRLRWLESNLYTGILHGGVLTSTPGSTTFTVTQGEGLIVSLNAFTASAPYPTVKMIEWPTSTQPIINSGSAKITYVGINDVGGIVQQTNAWGSSDINQWDNQIELGVVLHLSGSVSTGVFNSPQISYGIPQQTDDFLRAFGPLKVSGHTLQASGSSPTLSIKKSGGTAYRDGANYVNNPNHPSTVVENAINTSKIYRYYLSGSTPIIDTGIANAGYSTIDNDNYVNTATGQLATVGNSNWTIQRVFWIPNSPTNAFIVYYGNATYSTLLNAVNAKDSEPFTEAPNTTLNAIFVGYIVIEGGAGRDLLNAAECTIIPGGLFRNVGGIGSSGTAPVSTTLAGLSDVALSGLAAGDLLVYGGGQWNNNKTLNGNYTITGSLTVQSGITGNLTGTSSWASNAQTASYLTPSNSYTITSLTASTISASGAIIASSFTGSFSGSIGTAVNATSASYALTSSYISPSGNAFVQGGNSFGTTALLGTNDAQPLALETNGTTRMSINSNGNVGIGTTIPTGSLHIQNSVANIPILNLGGGVSFNNVSDLYVLNSYNTASGVGFAAKVIGVNISGSLTAENIPVQRTVWSGVASATAIVLSSDDPGSGNQDNAFQIWTSNEGTSGSLLTQKFSLSSTGNVGIGTTSPGALLDVSGSSRHGYRAADTHQFTGSVSVSGSLNATASWATNALTASSLVAANSYTVTNLTASNALRAAKIAERVVTFTPLTGSLTGAPAWYRIISGSSVADYGRVRLSTTFDNSRSDLEFTYGVRNYDINGAGAFINITRASTYNSVFSAVRVIEGTLTDPYAIDVLIGNYLNNTTPDTVTCLYESQFIGAVLDTPTFVSASATGSNSNVVKTVYVANSALYPIIGPVYSDGLSVATYQGQLTVGYRGNYNYSSPSTNNYALLVSGSVGIGTTSLGEKLTVSGSSYIIGGTGAVGTGTAYYLGNSSNKDISLTRVDAATLAIGRYYPSAWAETIRFTADGNVGIGTSSPGRTLEVSLSATGAAGGYLRLRNPNTTTNTETGVEFFNTTSNVVSDAAAAIRAIRQSSTNTSDLTISTTDNSNLTEKLRITSTGNVGIGTTGPVAGLSVTPSGSAFDSTNVMVAYFGKRTANSYGSTFIRVAPRSNITTTGSAAGSTEYTDIENNSPGDGPFRYGTYGDTNIINGNSYTAGIYGNINFVTSGSTRMTIAGGTAAGNVGIGTTNPTARLHVSGSTGGVFEVDTVGGTTAFYVSASGNVGIGTPNPLGRLHITASATNGESLVYLSKGSGSITQYYINAVNQLGQLNYRVSSDINGHASQTLYFAGTIHVYHDSYWSSFINNANYVQGGLGIGTTSQTHGYGVTIARPATSGSLYVSGSSVFTGSVSISDNVGIGTTSTSDRLSVISGSTRIASSALAGVLYLGNDTSNIYLQRDNNYDLSLVQNGDSNSALYLASAGSVYVNIDSNNNDTDKAFIVQNNALKAGTELFRIQENGNIGIGTTVPLAITDIQGTNVTLYAANYVGSVGTIYLRGNDAYNSGTAGAGIYLRGKYDSSSNVTTFGAISAIKENNIDGNYAGALTFLSRTNGQGSGAAEKMRIDSNGNVGIGTTSPAARLEISGSSNSALFNIKSAISGNIIFVTGSGCVGINKSTPTATFDISGSTIITGSLNVTTNVTCLSLTETSTEAVKYNIIPLPSQLDNVLKLKPVSFNYKTNDKHSIGLIAEEVAKIYPEFTSDTNDSISYGKITSVLIQSIKELKTIIDNQQKQIEDLSNKLK